MSVLSSLELVAQSFLLSFQRESDQVLTHLSRYFNNRHLVIVVWHLDCQRPMCSRITCEEIDKITFLQMGAV